jgi:DNA-binding transcriptional LysR family regulator
VSHIIAKLEEDFGFPLLYRNRSGISLTPDGEKMLPSIQELLSCSEQLSQEISDLNGVMEGKVRIAAFSSVACTWLPHIVRRFKEAHPQVTVNILQGSYGEIEEWLRTDAVDLAFVTGVFRTGEETEILPLATDRMMCALPKGFKTRSKNYVTTEEIAGEILIHSSSNSENEIYDYTDENDLRTGYEYIFDDDNAKLAMVEQKLGVCILPELILEGKPHDIKALPLKPAAERSISLAVAHAKFIAPATEEMKNLIVEYVSEL